MFIEKNFIKKSNLNLIKQNYKKNYSTLEDANNNINNFNNKNNNFDTNYLNLNNNIYTEIRKSK